MNRTDYFLYVNVFFAIMIAINSLISIESLLVCLLIVILIGEPSTIYCTNKIKK